MPCKGKYIRILPRRKNGLPVATQCSDLLSLFIYLFFLGLNQCIQRIMLFCFWFWCFLLWNLYLFLWCSITGFYFCVLPPFICCWVLRKPRGLLVTCYNYFLFFHFRCSKGTLPAAMPPASFPRRGDWMKEKRNKLNKG